MILLYITLKYLIDRQLPMSLPFMSDANRGYGSGAHESRYDMTGKKGLICRVLYEVILISYIVGTPQRGIVRPVDHHDRRELSDAVIYQ